MELFAKTDIGKLREINQDCLYIDNDSKFPLYIIADGMGGYSGGEVASNLAVLNVKKHLDEYLENDFNDNMIEKVIHEAFKKAHFEICEKANKNKELEEMGTTLDLLLIANNKIFIAHIGDSRIYKVEENRIEQTTKDHSYVGKLLEEGSISKEEAYNHPKKNMLMKALGGKRYIEPDIITLDKKENTNILMCTDGLTNMLKDNEILEIINNNDENIDKHLIDAANEKGGIDNITLIFIRGII